MLGEQQAIVLDAKPLEVHGVGFVDVTLRLRDGGTVSARLGSESAPSDLQAGEEVLAMRAANMVVSIKRPT